METIKRLTTPALIEEASALLYDVYIEQQKWHFLPDNPSQLRVEVHNRKRVLVDRYTKSAIWFGAFDNARLVGCVRLLSVDENNQLEIETYLGSQSIDSYIPVNDKKHSYEISKLATEKNYVGRGIVKRLLLACFRFCEQNHYPIFACTHNGYLKSLFKRIEFPIKKEFAFKYEPQDVSAVNFYYADYKKGEVKDTLQKLEYLENDVSNNARSLFKALQTVEPILPTPFYWMDTQGVVLGINELCLKAIGTTREIIGKKPYDFYKPEIAEHILSHNEEVMRKEAILSQEEWIEDVTTKEKKCFSSTKAPLYDDEGTIIGIVGTSIEITAQKEAELLKLKYERQQIELREQEKFAQLARQVAHDIHSPLAALKVLSERCEELPENKRSLLTGATGSILDVANNLISHYQPKDKSAAPEIEERQPLLVSDLLLKLVSEKKVQYLQQPVKFETEFADPAWFAFILVQKTEFRRAMSNLINNAVDALENREDGTVTVQLTVAAGSVVVKVLDNGKGMSRDNVEKMLEHRAFTEGKQDGHGLGLQQVWNTLDTNPGTMEVQSALGKGSSIQLRFSEIDAPGWIAQEIHPVPDTAIVILDDDESIHKAWNLRFSPLLPSCPALQLHHFTQGQEALEFLARLSPEEKNRVLFLSDYELPGQGRNGLQVIEASGIKNAILVTSYYSSPKILDAAGKLGIKILPKQMASVIPVPMG